MSRARVESSVQALRSASEVVSTVVVPAPIDGVITGRTVNLGQVVSMGQELLVVTDLSDDKKKATVIFESGEKVLAVGR